MSVISRIVSYAPKALGYGKRIVKAAPDAIFGTGAEVAGSAMRATKGGAATKAKAGFKALEGMQKSGSFWSRATGNLGLIKSMPAKYARAAKISGKGFFGQAAAGVKGLFKGLGKNMPFLAAASTLLFELPNIWSATKEQGVKEVGKAGARLAGGATGAAIGSAICPGIGTMVGWFVGDWLTGKVVGKSYSEKKAEAEEALAQAQAMQQQAQIPFQGGNPYNNPYAMTNPTYDYNNPYANDIMMQNINFNQLA